MTAEERSQLEERFWRNVNKDAPVPVDRPELGNCWEWTKAVNEWGYGRIWVKGKVQKTHRVGFYLLNGFWPEFGLHVCDNPPCVRHIVDGDHVQNMKDMMSKGRGKGQFAVGGGRV